MFERNTPLSPELSPRERRPYAPTPLDPWKAVDPDTGLNYFTASRDRMEEKVAEAVATSPFLTDSERPMIRDFLHGSLQDVLNRRIDYNHDSFQVLNDLEKPCETLQYAREGLATPAELIDILTTHPEIKALELAKLSHPLDFEASLEMDAVIAATLDAKQATPLAANVRHKRKRLYVDENNDEQPLLILTRKQDLGDIETASGAIRVVRRQSLFVRGDEVVCRPEDDSVLLSRIVKNPERLDELSQRLEYYFAHDFDPTNQFVQPAATSYYAKYL